MTIYDVQLDTYVDDRMADHLRRMRDDRDTLVRELADARDVVDMTQGTLTQLRAQLDQERNMRTGAQNTLVDFQDQVRNLAIRLHHNGTWCKAGMNDTLEELGLERWEDRYYVQVRVDLTVYLDAESADDAGDMVRSAIGRMDLSDDDGDMDVTDSEIIIRDVGSAD